MLLHKRSHLYFYSGSRLDAGTALLCPTNGLYSMQLRIAIVNSDRFNIKA
ncbi:MAG: hypothetical protein KME31_11490 [Tolypothrix carrinoi HA7290-LM1]|nr:hypothetical protein [Tolypothrix carrinoi HA7290-LM1]